MKLTVRNWTQEKDSILLRLKHELLATVSEEKHIFREVAYDSDALPVYGDIGGCLLLRPEGKVFCYEFLPLVDDECVTADMDFQWFEFAWGRAKSKFPELMDGLEFQQISMGSVSIGDKGSG